MESSTTTTTTEEWSLAKYLEDWPPEGTDADNAKTLGVIFIIMMGVFFCFCLSADLQFCAHKIIQLKKKVGKGKKKNTTNSKANGKARRNHGPGSSQGTRLVKVEGRKKSDQEYNTQESLHGLLQEEGGQVKPGRKQMLMTYDNPAWNDYDESPPPYSSSARRHSNGRY